MGSWPICLSIVLTVSSSMAVASWFNRVESQDPNNQSLPQVLFYTRLVADLLGRPATLLLPSLESEPNSGSSDNNNNSNGSNDNDDNGSINNDYGGDEYNFSNNNDTERKKSIWNVIMILLIIVSLRLLFVPFFFLYTASGSGDNKSSITIPKNDLGITLGVFMFSFSSGFLATWSYQLAPMLLTDQAEREFNTVKQASLLNVCFSASVLLGLILSFLLSFGGSFS